AAPSPSPRLRPQPIASRTSRWRPAAGACRRSAPTWLPSFAAPDGAADAGAAGRLSRSFSQLNWMMSSHGTKWKPELKADLRTVEQEMLDSGLVTSLVDLLLTLLRLRGAYDDLAVRVLLCLLNCTDRSLEFCLQFAKSQDKFFRSYFPDLLNAQDGGQMLELNTASLVECALGIGYNIMTRSCTEGWLSSPGMVDSAKPYLVSPVTRVSATALIFIAFAVGDSQAEIFLGAKKSINYLIRHPAAGTEGSGERGLRRRYSVRRCPSASTRLALNDANKDLLVELNVLSVVKLMLDSPEAQDVAGGPEILFTLSFRPGERPSASRRSSAALIVSGAIGASFPRWRGAVSSSDSLERLAFRLLGGQRSGCGGPRAGAAGTVGSMISYNHASKQQVERLHGPPSILPVPRGQQHRSAPPAAPLPPSAASGDSSQLSAHRCKWDYPLRPPPPTTARHIPAAAVSDNFEAWDTARVARWCSECGLPHQVADMRLTGRELRFLLAPWLGRRSS
uniref:SAM domain-containing protein n=1 Tax=Macrostomum lignano TaxID=282301 RepID=A0A1I8FHJ6_9PLAT